MKLKFKGRPRIVEVLLEEGNEVIVTHKNAIRKLGRSPYFEEVATKKRAKKVSNGGNESGNSEQSA